MQEIKNKQDQREIYNTPLAYAVQHKNNAIRMNSRSGGAFTALSDKVLTENGAIYGCILTKDLKVIHQRATTAEKRDKFRGSKYVESDMQNVFSQVKADLLGGREVLFSGVSCQVAGLKAFLSDIDTRSLFCIDIMCHGVPSPMIWMDYLNWSAKGKKIIDVDFRNKKNFGWMAHVLTIYFDRNRKKNSRIYTKIYYSNKTLRKSCYICPYKSIFHPGDITIADFWGIDKAIPDFDDNKGTSLVLVNSIKGKELFAVIKKDVNWISCSIEKWFHKSIVTPAPEPKDRDIFWKDYYALTFKKISRIYGDNTFFMRLKNLAKNYLKRV